MRAFVVVVIVVAVAGTCAVPGRKLYGLFPALAWPATARGQWAEPGTFATSVRSFGFISVTGNSIELAKIVVYMPICLFDLCKMGAYVCVSVGVCELNVRLEI